MELYEKCARCKIRRNTRDLTVPSVEYYGPLLDEYLCDDCYYDYLKSLEVFNNSFCQPERLNPEDAKKSVCDSLSSDNK